MSHFSGQASRCLFFERNKATELLSAVAGAANNAMSRERETELATSHNLHSFLSGKVAS